MSDYMTEVFAPVIAEYRAEVQRDTWGHLAPKRNAKYAGHVLFALGCFGSDNLNPTVIECVLKSKTCGEIDGSPWFYDALMDFLREQTHTDDLPNEPEPGIYLFRGNFRNYVFTGITKRLEVK